MKKNFVWGSVFAALLTMGLVSCDSTPKNGCKCTFEFDGEEETEKITNKQMKKYYDDVTTCKQLQDAITEEYEDRDIYDYYDDWSVSCKGY